MLEGSECYPYHLQVVDASHYEIDCQTPSHAGPETGQQPAGNHWLLGEYVYSRTGWSVLAKDCLQSLGETDQKEPNVARQKTSLQLLWSQFMA